jgi:hypothetical protein
MYDHYLSYVLLETQSKNPLTYSLNLPKKCMQKLYTMAWWPQKLDFRTSNGEKNVFDSKN